MSATIARTVDWTRSTSVEPRDGITTALAIPSMVITINSSISVYPRRCARGTYRSMARALPASLAFRCRSDFNLGLGLALGPLALVGLGLLALVLGHVRDLHRQPAVQLALDALQPRVHRPQLGDDLLALLRCADDPARVRLTALRQRRRAQHITGARVPLHHAQREQPRDAAQDDV